MVFDKQFKLGGSEKKYHMCVKMISLFPTKRKANRSVRICNTIRRVVVKSLNLPVNSRSSPNDFSFTVKQKEVNPVLLKTYANLYCESGEKRVLKERLFYTVRIDKALNSYLWKDGVDGLKDHRLYLKVTEFDEPLTVDNITFNKRVFFVERDIEAQNSAAAAKRGYSAPSALDNTAVVSSK